MAKYKIEECTPLYDEVKAVMDEFSRCHNAARDYVLGKFGKGSSWTEPSAFAIGGVGYVSFDKQPSGWVRSPHYSNMYRPDRKGATLAIAKEMDALPLARKQLLSTSLRYGVYTGPNVGWGRSLMSTYPGVQYGADAEGKQYLLVDVPDYADGKYKPVDGMKEINFTEWLSLIQVKSPKPETGKS